VAPVLVDLGIGSKGVDVVPGSPPAGVLEVTCQPALVAYGRSVVVKDGLQLVDLDSGDPALRKPRTDVRNTPSVDLLGVVVQWEEILFVGHGHIFSSLASVRESVLKAFDLHLCGDKLALVVSEGVIQL
jgi:hypothetical protein